MEPVWRLDVFVSYLQTAVVVKGPKITVMSLGHHECRRTSNRVWCPSDTCIFSAPCRLFTLPYPAQNIGRSFWTREMLEHCVTLKGQVKLWFDWQPGCRYHVWTLWANSKAYKIETCTPLKWIAGRTCCFPSEIKEAPEERSQECAEYEFWPLGLLRCLFLTNSNLSILMSYRSQSVGLHDDELRGTSPQGNTGIQEQLVEHWRPRYEA